MTLVNQLSGLPIENCQRTKQFVMHRCQRLQLPDAKSEMIRTLQQKRCRAHNCAMGNVPFSYCTGMGMAQNI